MAEYRLTEGRGPQHPELIASANSIKDAESNYRAVLRRIRKSCQHPRVAQQEDGSYGADLRHHHARRICCDCGYEETNYWCDRTIPWRGHNSGDGHTTAKEGAPLVLTSEFVKRVPFSGSVFEYRPISEKEPTGRSALTDKGEAL